MPQGVNANTGQRTALVATDELGSAVVPLAVVARQQQRCGVIVLPIKRQGPRSAQGRPLQPYSAAYFRNNVGIALSIHCHIVHRLSDEVAVLVTSGTAPANPPPPIRLLGDHADKETLRTKKEKNGWIS